MIVDGVEREAGEGQEAFQLENVQENHSIKLIFAKIPLNLRNFLIAAACTAAVGGVIGWYLLLLHVKRERRRKRARARIARQRAAWAGEAGSADVTPDP